MEFYATWGNIPIFAADIPHLNFMRAQACWLDSELDDLHMRRRSVYAIARDILEAGDVPDGELERMWSILGVESCSPRIADAIATLYNSDPVRVFHAASSVNEGFGQLYGQLNVNLAMQQAYRAALFTNTVLLLPDWDSNTIQVLTPDYFRLVGKGSKVTELWLVHADGGFSPMEFHRWTAEDKTVFDDKGKFVRIEPNTLGRLPGSLLKLNPSNDLYGAGITEAAEINAVTNLLSLFTTRIALFQSYSVGVVMNMKFAKGTRIGPGSFIGGDNVVGESHTAPSFEYVTPDGKFQELEELRQRRIKSFERTQGLPAFLVDEGAGQPPTGAALQVLERALNDKRKQHIKALSACEKDLASLLALQGKSHGRDLGIDSSFRIEYAAPETFSDPNIELDFDLKKSQNGLMKPSALLEKYAGAEAGISDDTAISEIMANKKFFAGSGELRSTVGGATAFQQLVIAYESQQINRTAAVNTAVLLYGFTQLDAEKIFVDQSATTPLTKAA